MSASAASVLVPRLHLWEANRLLLDGHSPEERSHTWALRLDAGAIEMTARSDGCWESVIVPVVPFGGYGGEPIAHLVAADRIEQVTTAPNTESTILLSVVDGKLRAGSHDLWHEGLGGVDATSAPPSPSRPPVGRVKIPVLHHLPHVDGWGPVIADVQGLHVWIPGAVAHRFLSRNLENPALGVRGARWYVCDVTPATTAGLAVSVVGSVHVR